MKRVLGLVCMLAVLAASVAAQAPKVITEEDYSKVMKEVSTLMQSVRKNATGNAWPEIAKDAARLEVLFRDGVTFWQARKTEDAVAIAKTALTAAGDLAKAASAGDVVAAAAAQKTLQSTCTTCHMAHREQLPDKTYRIK